MGLFKENNTPDNVVNIPTIDQLSQSFNDSLHKDITVHEFEEACLHQLNSVGRLNTVTRVMISNITALYSSVLECQECIDRDGAMLETIGSTGQPILKKNEAVTLQEKNISSIAKLLSQLDLDNIVELPESEV